MGKHLGDFEQLVLLAVLGLGPKAYGMAVRREIESKTGRRITLGAVYTTLDRLEEKGMVSSWTGEATPERGGRAKRFFRVEASGQKALNESWTAYNALSTGLLPNAGTI